MTGRGFFWPTFVVAGAVGGCTESPASAPAAPTWVDDVAPILRANCFQCHGPSANETYRTVRWDVYNIKDPRYAALGFFKIDKAFVGAKDQDHFALIPIWTSPETSDEGRMPPPPATRLSPRDLQVLTNWESSGFAQGSHSPNHQPTITWLQWPTLIQVSDEDQDQVLGKLDCQGKEIPISRSGGITLPEGLSFPCKGTLFDGFDEAAVHLE